MQEHERDAVFLLMAGLCFVVFGRRFGHSLANQLEGPRSPDERERDGRWNTIVTRAIGAGLIGLAVWRWSH